MLPPEPRLASCACSLTWTEVINLQIGELRASLGAFMFQPMSKLDTTAQGRKTIFRTADFRAVKEACRAGFRSIFEG